LKPVSFARPLKTQFDSAAADVTLIRDNLVRPAGGAKEAPSNGFYNRGLSVAVIAKDEEVTAVKAQLLSGRKTFETFD